MAGVKRSIAEVTGSAENLQPTNVAAAGALKSSDASSDLKLPARAAGASPNFDVPVSEDALDDDDFDATDDGLSEDAGNENQSNAASPKSVAVDFDGVPQHQGKPLTEINLNSEFKDGKPWLKFGADITDWFNYGFNEFTWQRYCEKQREMRGRFAVPHQRMPAMEPQRLQTIGTAVSAGSNNFASEVGNMMPRSNRPMIPSQQPPPFIMQMMQQQRMQMQAAQQQQSGNFPSFRPNMGPPAQPPMQGQQPLSNIVRMQTSSGQPATDMQNSFQQQQQQQLGQTIMIRSQQPMNPAGAGPMMQTSQMQRTPFSNNFNTGRPPNAGMPFRHPGMFGSNLSAIPQQQGGVRPGMEQKVPLPSGMQGNQPTGPPNVGGGPRRQLTSLTGN